jgi:peroxiredoxin
VSAYQTRNHVSRQPAPEFSLLDLRGNRVSLSAYRHKKVLLHFWATWCGVCRAELPSLRSLQRSLGPDEVLLTIVEDSDDAEAVRRFAREHELEYPVLLGTDEVRRAYRVRSFPTNYYVNGDGSIRTSTVGLSTRLGMAFHLLRTGSH